MKNMKRVTNPPPGIILGFGESLWLVGDKFVSYCENDLEDPSSLEEIKLEELTPNQLEELKQYQAAGVIRGLEFFLYRSLI